MCMDRRDDIPEEPHDIDLRSFKQAMMRRDEAVERFREAKARLLREGTTPQTRRPDSSPGRS
jgi:hypothetical protein